MKTMKIERSQVFEIAGACYEGTSFDAYLNKARQTFFKKVLEKLMENLKSEYPDRDFNFSKRTHKVANVTKSITRILKG